MGKNKQGKNYARTSRTFLNVVTNSKQTYHVNVKAYLTQDEHVASRAFCS